MKDLLSSLVIVLLIISVHALAEFIAQVAPMIGVLLFAWIMSSIAVAMLQALGVLKIDLSKMRN